MRRAIRQWRQRERPKLQGSRDTRAPAVRRAGSEAPKGTTDRSRRLHECLVVRQPCARRERAAARDVRDREDWDRRRAAGRSVRPGEDLKRWRTKARWLRLASWRILDAPAHPTSTAIIARPLLFDLLRNSGQVAKRVDVSQRRLPSKSTIFRRFAWHMPCSTRLRAARFDVAGSGNALGRGAGNPVLF